MNRKILYTLVLLLFFAACKYEDGPAISLRSKYQRLEGDWQIENLKIDGIDSTQRYLDSCNCKLWFLKIHDYGWGDGQLIRLIDCKLAIITLVFEGYWKFSNNKKILHVWLNMNGSWYQGIGPIGCIDSDWKILRLTKTEFWFTTTLQNKIYEFKFKR